MGRGRRRVRVGVRWMSRARSRLLGAFWLLGFVFSFGDGRLILINFQIF